MSVVLKLKPWVYALLIVLGGFCLYVNSLHNAFHFDDFPSIVNNSAIRNLADLKRVYSFWPTRCVNFFSLALNYCLHGLELQGYHIFSVLIHVAAALMVFWLIRLTLSTPGMRSEERFLGKADLIAFGGSLVFLVHPLQTQAVNYIVQRCVLWAAFFYAASLACYVKARLLRLERVGGKQWVLYYAASLIAALLAMFSKENAISLPVMMICYEFFFFQQEKPQRWAMLMPLLSTGLTIPLVWLSIHPVDFSGAQRAMEGYAGGVTIKQYLLTQIRVLVTYIRLLLVPIHQRVEYDYVLSNSPLELPVLMSAAVLALVGYYAVKLFSRYKMISFGIGWFLLTLLPESTVWPNRDVIFEHRLYLPMIGFSIVVSSALFYIFTRQALFTGLRLFAVVIFIYAGMSYHRNVVWSDEFSLWDDAVKESPRNARAYLNRGAAYQSRGDLDHAMADYNMVVGLGPVDAVTLSNRGAIFRMKGDEKLALANFDLAIKINPSYVGTYVNRSLLFQSQGRREEAIADLTKAISLSPAYAEAYNNRGVLYAYLGKMDLARADFDQAILLHPAYQDAIKNRAVISK